MRILFLSDNFPPEVNAPATRTYEHCREWVRKGIDVTVVTCFPNFPDGKLLGGYRNRLFQKEIIDGIKVIRVFTYITRNSGFVKRTIDYISFGISAFFAGLLIKSDIIVATSPQFFTAVWARRLAFFKRLPWIMEVRDLWPESIKSVGAIKADFLLSYFVRQELRLYRSARHIVVVTDSFKIAISERGIDPGKITVIKNGSNLELYKPGLKSDSIVQSVNPSGKFVVGYIGTLGMAHKLDFIIRAASSLEKENILFLLIGAGAEKERLVTLIKDLEVDNVKLLGMISKNEVPFYLNAIDVSLVNLKKSDTFKTVIPSKIFESAAMEKPILLGVDGEARNLVESYSAGLFFEPENESDFISKLLKLRDDNNLYNDLKQGCRKLAVDFDRKRLAYEMAEVLITNVN